MDISKLFRSILWIILFIITLGLGMVGFIQRNIINPKTETSNYYESNNVDDTNEINDIEQIDEINDFEDNE